MTDQMQRAQDLIDSISAQRNVALDTIVQMQAAWLAEKREFERRILELKQEIEDLKTNDASNKLPQFKTSP